VLLQHCCPFAVIQRARRVREHTACLPPTTLFQMLITRGLLRKRRGTTHKHTELYLPFIHTVSDMQDLLPPVPPEHKSQRLPEIIDTRNLQAHSEKCAPLIDDHRALYQQALLTRQQTDTRNIKDKKNFKVIQAQLPASTELKSMTQRAGQEAALLDFVKDRLDALMQSRLLVRSTTTRHPPSIRVCWARI